LWELDHFAWEGVENNSSIYLERHPDREQIADAASNPEIVEEDARALSPFAQERDVDIFVSTATGKTIPLTTKLSATVEQLRVLIQDKEGIPPCEGSYISKGIQIEDNRRLDSYGITEGSDINLILRLRGGKPAIYLLSPQTLSDIEVAVILCPEWTFSVLYPLTTSITLATSGRTAAAWTVDVQPDGTMRDSKTGLDCSYLFWEAESRAKRGDDAPKTDLDEFSPAFPQPFLQHRNEVLQFEQFITRIDAILKDLCLTAAMRTGFIVYWLPAFHRIRDREQLIKFTFVPQEAYEKAAFIHIGAVSPPKTISRVFMLFSGADSGSEESQTPVDWVSHVGLDQEAMKDTEAFRVLEWGGMEVRD